MVSEYAPSHISVMESPQHPYLEPQLHDRRNSDSKRRSERNTALNLDDNASGSHRGPGKPIALPGMRHASAHESIYSTKDPFTRSKTLGTTRRPTQRPDRPMYVPPPLKDKNRHDASHTSSQKPSPRRTYTIPPTGTSAGKSQTHRQSFEPGNIRNAKSRPGFEGKQFAGGPQRLTPRTHDNSTGTGRIRTRKEQQRIEMLNQHIMEDEISDYEPVESKSRYTVSTERSPECVKRRKLDDSNKQARRHIQITEDDIDEDESPTRSLADDERISRTRPGLSNNSAQPIEIDSDDENTNGQNHNSMQSVAATQIAAGGALSRLLAPVKDILPSIKPRLEFQASDSPRKRPHVALTEAGIMENGRLAYPDSDSDGDPRSTEVQVGSAVRSVQAQAGTQQSNDKSVFTKPTTETATTSPYFANNKRLEETHPSHNLPVSLEVSDDDEKPAVLLPPATKFRSSIAPKAESSVKENIVHKFAIEGCGSFLQIRRVGWSLFFAETGFSFTDEESREKRKADIDYDNINSWIFEDQTWTINVVLKKPIPFFDSSKCVYITLQKNEGHRFIRAMQDTGNERQKMTKKCTGVNEKRLGACRESCIQLTKRIRSPLNLQEDVNVEHDEDDLEITTSPPVRPATHDRYPKWERPACASKYGKRKIGSRDDFVPEVSPTNTKQPTPIALPQGRDQREKKDERHLLVDTDEVSSKVTRSGNTIEDETLLDPRLLQQVPRTTRASQRTLEQKLGRNARSTEPLLIYPNIKGQNSVTLYEDDLDRLKPDEFLNDSIVEFYLKYNYDRLSEQQKSEAHIFNTFFYQRLTHKKDRNDKDGGYEAVKKWTSKGRGIDLFSKKFVVIPINENLHWYLAVIVNLDKVEFGEDAQRKAEVSCIHLTEEAENTEIDAASGTESAEVYPNQSTTQFGLDDNGQTIEAAYSPSTTTQAHSAQPERIIETPPPFSLKEDVSVDLCESYGEQADAAVPSLTARIQAEERAKHGLPTSVLTHVQSSQLDEDQEMGGIASLTIDDELSETSQVVVASSAKKSKAKKGKTKKQTYASKMGKHISVDTPTIIILDSLGNTHTRVPQVLKEYLVSEAKDKKNEVLNPAQFASCKADVPSQDNFSDCGLFLIQYVDTLLRQPGVVNNLLNKVVFDKPEAQQAHKRAFKNMFDIDRIPLRRKEMIKQICELSEPFRKQARAEEQLRKAEKARKLIQANLEKQEDENQAKEGLDSNDAVQENSCSILSDFPIRKDSEEVSPQMQNISQKTTVSDSEAGNEDLRNSQEDKLSERTSLVGAHLVHLQPHEDSVDELDCLARS